MEQFAIRPGSAIIIQQVYRGSEYTNMLALTLERNLEYCKKHNFDFELYYGNIIEEWNPIDGAWAKLALIHGALTNGYQYVIWLDADSLIADVSADLRDGCPKPQGVGVVRHPASNNAFCVGNLYVTNSELTRAFMVYWMRWYPGPSGGWHEQAALILLNVLECFHELIIEIDHKYNSCRAGGSHVDNAIVEGFHGEGSAERRLKLMKEYLQAHT